MRHEQRNEAKGSQGAYGTSGMFRLTATILGIILFLAFMGCQKQAVENPPAMETLVQDSSWAKYPLDTVCAEPESGYANRVLLSVPGTSYTSVPAINSYQSSPSSSVSSGGFIYYGGPFQSCVSTISGSSITFKMKRTDGLTFPSGSVLKIKLSTAGGTVITTKTLTSAASASTISINESSTWNINGGSGSNSNNYKNYVATWFNPASGYNFYTKPMMVVAVPTGWGANLAAYNNVNVYSNGWGGFSSTNYLTDNYGQKYQCVHYIKRYYLVVKNKSIGNGNANVYWDSYTSHNLTQRINNGAGVPQSGDIICFKSSSGSYHVGIVAGVVSGKLRVFQENVGQTLVSGNYCSGYKDFTFTISSGKYNVSASVLGSNWTTLGWVR